MIDYSEDPALAAKGETYPSVSSSAMEFLLESDVLREALFGLADLFRIPLTNNLPWYEDGDKNKPVYMVTDFIEVVEELFLHFGWTPPDA